jgi:23S rRNA (uracil1939-C5)-methyltransferase
MLEFISSDFIQINSEVNKLMVSKAIELLCINKSDTVTDLFCGIGNFSLPLSRYAKNVIGVELQEDFIKRAKCNAKLNNINNIEFFTGDLFKSDNNWSNLKCNKLLLDPARSGALEVVSNIELFNAKKIVYVSCHPGTLARDTDILVNEKKYTLDTAGIIDMFPHTSHVESIALFSK